MSTEPITPENVKRKTWTDPHNFDIRLDEFQMHLILRALLEMVYKYDEIDRLAPECEELASFFDKILKVRYSTP